MLLREKRCFSSIFRVFLTELREVFSWLMHVPLALGGLALSFSTLGFVWSIVLPDYDYLIDPLSLLIPMTFLIILLLRFLIFPDLLYRELSDGLIGSTLPTTTMALMSVASGLFPRTPNLSVILWSLGVLLNFLFASIFFFKQTSFFSVSTMVPSWFLLPIGFGFAVITGSDIGFSGLSQGLMLFFAIGYFTLLPLMVIRIIKFPAFQANEKPTYAIFSAPPNVLLAGYIIGFDASNYWILLFLTLFALSITVIVYITFFGLLKLPFTSTHILLNFPAVVSSTAMLQLMLWLDTHGFSWLSDIAEIIGCTELVMATAIVCYMSWHFLYHAVRIVKDS